MNFVTKSFEKMAEFRYSYMAVKPTSDNVKEETQRKLRFSECLLSFGSGCYVSHLLSRIVQIKGYQKKNCSSSVCCLVWYMCEIWPVKHRLQVSG